MTLLEASALETRREHAIERLTDRLPARLARAVRWLRRPSSVWARVPVGLLLCAGSVLAILPVFGLWMLPLGLILLAEDLAPLRRLRGRLLDWGMQRHPAWFA